MLLSKRVWVVPFLLFLCAFFFRSFYLARVPTSITNDEFDYILAGQSIFFTGDRVPYSPALGLFTWDKGQTASGVVLAELPAFIIAPFVGLFPHSLFAAKLPYALASAATAVVLYFLSKQLFGKEKISIFVALVFALNPWSIHFGRTSFEFTFAIFFYLAGLTLLLRAQKLSAILTGVTLLTAGFLSYHGMKMLLLPLLVVAAVYRWQKLSKPLKKQFSLVLATTVVLCIGYIFSLKYQSTGGRVVELLGSDISKIERSVTEARRLSIPGRQQPLIYNKPTQFIRTAIDSYFRAFSVPMLFLYGDGIAAYSLWEHGYFYYVDLVFILAGFIGAFIYSRRAFLLLLGLVLIAPLPSVFNTTTTSYAIRSGLLFPLLIIFAGVGIYFIFEQLPKKFRFPAKVVVAGVYLLSLLQFLNLYFYRLPIFNSEAFYLSQKIMAHYINLTKESTGTPILVSLTEPQSQFLKYLFYSGVYNKENAGMINEKIKNHDYTWGNVTFDDSCTPAIEATASGRTWLYVDMLFCENNHPKDTLRISSPADSGTIVNIYNDKLCGADTKLRYPNVGLFSDLEVQSMDRLALCQTWISRYFDLENK